MSDAVNNDAHELDDIEIKEWLSSLDYVLQSQSPSRVQYLLQQLKIRAQQAGIQVPFGVNTPYINTISSDKQSVFPGNREIERRIKSIIRWNAMAMVVRANRIESGKGRRIFRFIPHAYPF